MNNAQTYSGVETSIYIKKLTINIMIRIFIMFKIRFDFDVDP
jgi:hypothetical protein